MKKRTYKYRVLRGQLEDAIASGTSQVEVARRLGVDTSTLRRWRQQGKMPPPGSKPRPVAAQEPAGVSGHELLRMSPTNWRTWVHSAYVLDPHKVMLVDLAARTMEIALDSETPSNVRVSAAGMAARLIRQLGFEVPRENRASRPYTIA